MKKIKNFKPNLLFKALISLILTNSLFTYGNKEPEEINGFRLIEKRFVKEVNADCYYFEHIKSGARLIKIAANDPNKTFCIGFHTIPNSDCGTPHIMEHCVLQGSKNFPVKSPLEAIYKGSLITFANASTGKDLTRYPMASMNEKSYFQLMHIYLDAVFNPSIYDDEKIFKQEGWHYELNDENVPIVYRGIVHGEMKGFYSGPTPYISYYTYKNLFPDTGYGYESGGLPTAIPSLTLNDFYKFHRKYYNAENSYIMLYGDANLGKELAFIDKNYLSKYSRTGNQILIEDQKPFSSMKDINEYYPVMEGSKTDNQTYFSLSFVYGNGCDQKLSYALSILARYLMNNEAAPLKIALQNSGIGKSMRMSNTTYKQNVIQIQINNSSIDKKQQVYDIIMRTLKEIVNNGVDQREIESILDYLEFILREDNDANKGITYSNKLLQQFIYTKNPFLGLEYEKTLKEIRNAIKNRYFEEIIQKALIDNPHCVYLTLEPKPGLDNEISRSEEEKLKKYKENLSNIEIDKLVAETKELIDFQNKSDSPEALATIPILELSDINPNAIFYSAVPKNINGIKLLHKEDFTNGIIYTRLFFDLSVLPEDRIQYASLLSNILASLDTKNFTFSDLDREIKSSSGGIYTYITSYLENENDDKLIPKFVVGAKSTTTKVDRLFKLLNEILCNTQFTDTTRIRILLNQYLVQVETSFKNNGNNLALLRFRSYLTKSGMFDEMNSGYEYYLFLKDIVKEFESNPNKIISELVKVSSLLFNTNNLVIGITCDNNDYKIFSKNLKILTDDMKREIPTRYIWTLEPEKKNEGFQTASKIQFVYSGYNLKKLGYEMNGKYNVMNRFISFEWLFQQIRVVGGAYGGGSFIMPNGDFIFRSFRDPKLSETLINIKNTPKFIKEFNVDDKTITKYIIGSISLIDNPASVSQRGDIAFSNYFTKKTVEDANKERHEMLQTTKNDLIEFSKIIQEILDQQVILVYGNDQKIEENKDIFKTLVKFE